MDDNKTSMTKNPSWSRWLGFMALTHTARVRVPDWE